MHIILGFVAICFIVFFLGAFALRVLCAMFGIDPSKNKKG